MTTIFDIKHNEFITNVAEELKKLDEFKAPEWSLFVKTSVHKERPPENLDWWHHRAASILRKVATLGPIGVNKLKRKYGGKKNRGFKPGKKYDASGNIIRKILQASDKAGFTEHVEKGVHKGRILTPKGLSFLGKISEKVKKNGNV